MKASTHALPKGKLSLQMTKLLSLCLAGLMLQGCFIGFDEPKACPLGYVKYGTVPEMENGKMKLLPFITSGFLEIYFETFTQHPFENSHNPVCCVQGVYVLVSPIVIAGTVIDIGLIPLRVFYGAITYPFAHETERSSIYVGNLQKRNARRDRAFEKNRRLQDGLNNSNTKEQVLRAVGKPSSIKKPTKFENISEFWRYDIDTHWYLRISIGHDGKVVGFADTGLREFMKALGYDISG